MLTSRFVWKILSIKGTVFRSFLLAFFDISDIIFTMNTKTNFLQGLKSGIPIGLGYLSVSFSFGIMAVSYGLDWWQAVLVSMLNLTSAGQLAGVEIMCAPYQFIEMLVSQLTINIRYSFMSISLSQKADSRLRGLYRWLFGFFITDEIFAVAVSQKKVTRAFMSGVAIFPYIGWTAGTLFGAVLGNVLPDSIMSALCIAIYGMFIAIVAPDAKQSKSLLCIVAVSCLLSCGFYFLPVLNKVSSGLAISICAVLAAIFGAALFPIDTEAEDGQ